MGLDVYIYGCSRVRLWEARVYSCGAERRHLWDGCTSMGTLISPDKLAYANSRGLIKGFSRDALRSIYGSTIHLRVHLWDRRGEPGDRWGVYRHVVATRCTSMGRPDHQSPLPREWGSRVIGVLFLICKRSVTTKTKGVRPWDKANRSFQLDLHARCTAMGV